MQRYEQSALPIRVLFNVEKLGAAAQVVPIGADAAACAALAKYLNVIAVEKFHAELTVNRWRGRGVNVEGTVSATIVQECVVSLEPVPSHVKETIKARFLPESLLEGNAEPAAEIVIDPLADDPPEPFDGRVIDLGALALEFLALGIDPYPRAPGVALQQPEITTAGMKGAAPAGKKNPFQLLAGLRKPDD